MTGTNYKFLDRNPEHDQYLKVLIDKYWEINDELRTLWDKVRDGEYEGNPWELTDTLSKKLEIVKCKMYVRFFSLVHGDYDRIASFKRKYLID